MIKSKLRNYVAIAARYAEDVVSGKISACQWTIKACRRQIEDLERAKSKSYPYKFDKDKASRVCRFIEMLRHIKGEWAKTGARIELQPWQIFIQPNEEQTSVEFREMLQNHLALRGNAYAQIDRKMGRPARLVPLHPDRVEVRREKGELVYRGNPLFLPIA
jgi:hypothetical protein